MRACLVVLPLVVIGCGGDDGGPPPLGTVPQKLGAMAVGTSSLFAIDTADQSLLELGLDGKVIGKLETFGPVTEVAAAGDLVAWIEAEGANKHVRRRKAGMIDTLPTFSAHVAVTDEGVFYSDTGILAVWTGDTPDRIGTPGGDAVLIGADTTYAYTLEGGAVKRYDRRMGTNDVVVMGAMTATVGGGQLAYRTADGVRIHDVFTTFDHSFGMPPAGYPCQLLISGRAVMCGKYRCLEEVTEELLEDPVGGYAANGRDLYWTKTSGSGSELYKVDSEMVIK